MEMTINRALSELKLLGKKIEQKTDELLVADSVLKTTQQEVKDAFVRDQEAKIQQLNDMVLRRNKIKSAVVLSNSKTVVTVAGVQMTVAEAIERKSSIQFEKDINRKMRERFYGAKNAVERHNETKRQAADKQAEQALGADTESNKGEQYKAIFDAYFGKHEAEVIAPQGIESKIEKDRDVIDEFEQEVDFILNESNTITKIEV